MLKFLVYAISLCFIKNVVSQNNTHSHVKLIEKENGKRLELFAKNTDSISYSVFLRVTTNDFRRSSNRPVLETVAANSEKRLLTLIKLTGKKGNYDYQLIVNKYTEELSFTKDDDGIEVNFNDAVNNELVTVFETANCALCEDAKTILTNNNISFKSNNFRNNANEIFKLLKITKDTIDKSFILKIEDSIYSNITSKDVLIKTVKKHFPDID